MPWIIGIDEAGYGPNLGPLVMTSVAFQVPETLVGKNLWKPLAKCVRREPGKDDRRIWIDDSKRVYSSTRGLHELEFGVLAIHGCSRQVQQFVLRELVRHLCPECEADLDAEAWFLGHSELPIEADLAEVVEASQRFADGCQSKEILLGHIQSIVICAGRFNQLLSRWQSKGAILGEGLARLLLANLERCRGSDGIHFFIDKHGGRNNYAAMIQDAVPAGMVMTREEGLERSRYDILGLECPVTVTVEPRADGSHMGVALASMVSKYLRETLMIEFNAFWQQHVPGLEPTAGYPGDATRFFTSIEPICAKLGIPESAVWRKR